MRVQERFLSTVTLSDRNKPVGIRDRDRESLVPPSRVCVPHGAINCVIGQ